MEYTSTRDQDIRCTSAQAILTGLSADGGLFVPSEIDSIDFAALQGKSYEEIAAKVLASFLPDYDPDFLKQAVEQSYGANFANKAGYLSRLEDTLYSLELWHGPTAAFKDYALQLMPRLLVQARQKLNEAEDTLILVATSGDTGSAALAGYSNLPGIKIAVFYPEDGTSELQRLQMTTQQGSNVAVYGVRGNFDDAQRGVKTAFVNKELAEKLLEKHYKLSSANSINWGRLAPQIVYYVTSYLALCQQGVVQYGQPVDFCVPTGNFGDIMAGWYAKAAGLPIGRLICASNCNNVLADFLASGQYDANRPFHKTTSPSMDILVSSNLERLLWHVSGSDETVRGWMQALAQTGVYQVDGETMARIREVFSAGWASEKEVSAELKSIYDHYHYLCDPHTAVGFKVARQQRRENVPMVVLSTASPFKFPRQVLKALDMEVPAGEFDALRALQENTGNPAPPALAALSDKEVRFKDVIDPAEILDVPVRLA